MVDVAAVASSVDEDGAWELFAAMSGRFGWVGVLFDRASVVVWDNEKNEPASITDEEFEAVRATRSWADQIAQIAGLAGQEWLPLVERNPDGSFQILGDD